MEDVNIERIKAILEKSNIAYSIYLHPRHSLESDADYTILVSDLNKVRMPPLPESLDWTVFVYTYESFFDLLKWGCLPVKKPILMKLGGNYILYRRLRQENVFIDGLDVGPLIEKMLSYMNGDSYYVHFALVDLGLQDIGFGIMYSSENLIAKGKRRIQENITRLPRKEDGVLETIEYLTTNDLLLRMAYRRTVTRRYSIEVKRWIPYLCFFNEIGLIYKGKEKIDTSNSIVVQEEGVLGDVRDSIGNLCLTSTKFPEIYLRKRDFSDPNSYEDPIIKKHIALIKRDKETLEKVIYQFPFDERIWCFLAPESHFHDFVEGRLDWRIVQRYLLKRGSLLLEVWRELGLSEANDVRECIKEILLDELRSFVTRNAEKVLEDELAETST